MKKSATLSIIVPTYNEEKNIAQTVNALARFIETSTLQAEALIVCDGCTDNTVAIAKSHEHDKIRVLHYERNLGKGGAIKHGFQYAQGNIIVFFDAGLDFPTSEITKFYDLLTHQGADGVIGSKRHEQSRVAYPQKRWAISRMGQLVVKALFRLPYSDTQVGIKMFKREVLETVLPKIVIRQYAFDIELLMLCHRHGFRMIEAPITLDFNKGTSGVNWKSVFRAFADTLRIYKYLRKGRYAIPNHAPQPETKTTDSEHFKRIEDISTKE